ncbi:hypothetical protein [Bacillus atrophaeus]|uniref:Uncharacterized protein n=1 Tax=Bacillus atrophaeus (strain 1942) TaxID=720555 RepID=A0ABM5LYE9_BACA1|nr:hypothetical protein [Bacillus atrophaeus]ADP32891.1 hypothetical protein BATR1942_09790 [Bacillus atrophaeus 1942]AIK45829.1 hypothetical protein DJ95_1845 [Bacillus atrophaeus subsp. globigii]EIM11989.1 hypothetical protein UY9_03568 [Bacillus atrophaeus C89]KFK81527.1 hypothetical protein DK44_1788 [Bacillus atrophaeus]MDS9997134.1 hypothetical protein [Bacillus atrophaeus]
MQVDATTVIAQYQAEIVRLTHELMMLRAFNSKQKETGEAAPQTAE